MTAWPAVALGLIVAAIHWAHRRPGWQAAFRWLPVPLWCYALPMLGAALGMLPPKHPVYHALTDGLLPVALGLLLLGVDVPAVIRAGARALGAAAVGAAGIVAGVALWARILHDRLPPEAWRGAGALAGTWTGGTMNLLALRAILGTPEPMFASLIIVDALIAYAWMALLVAASALQGPIDRWLRAAPILDGPGMSPAEAGAPPRGLGAQVGCALIAAALALGARLAARHLPTSTLVSSSSGWTVVLVTTAALGLSLLASVRRLGSSGNALGYSALYLALAATGAQASLTALWSAPVWIVVGIGTAAVHGLALLAAGRLFRIPLGLLATASQANIGGVVSAPLVGAVYHQSLAPVGLLLAMLGNALGTYLGVWSAALCR